MREFIGKNNITFPVGPLLSNSDGLTPVTDLSIGSCDIASIQKYGGMSAVVISTNSWASVGSAGGHYNLTLTNSQADTLGPLRISIQKSGAILPFFEDVLLVSSDFWNAKYGAIPWATYNQVSSLDVRVQGLPNSATLNAHILTLPISSGLDSRVQSACYRVMDDINADNLVTSSDLSAIFFGPIVNAVASLDTRVGSVDSRIQTLPSSSTLNTQIATLPTSLTLNAHMATLATSSALYTMVRSMDIRVSSIGIQVGSVDQRVSGARGDISSNYAILVTLPSSAMFVDRVSSLDVRVQSLDTRVASLDVRVSSISIGATQVASIAFGVWDYSSRTLTSAGAGGATASEVQSACAQVVVAYALNTLMSSSDLSARFAILPNSQTLNAHIITLPTSEAMHAEFQTLPTSAGLNSHIGTLPNSAAVYRAISSMDARVASLQNISLSDVASGIFGYDLEGGLTLVKHLRYAQSVNAGVSSGGGTNELVFRDFSNLKNRIVAVVNSYGNRVSMTLDGD